MADEVAQRTDGDGAVWRPALSGLCACLIGIGLARFAYTPLIPALIEAEWFTASQAFYLGAANLAGYLAGALLAAPMAAWRSPVAMLRIMMLIATVSFFACAFPLSFLWSFLWFFLWRFLSGYAGGALMVLAASTVLSAVPRSRRGLAGGVIFTGVGLGIIASGTLVPLVLQAGLVEIWFTLGFLALALTVFAWRGVAGRRAQRSLPQRYRGLYSNAHPAFRCGRSMSATVSTPSAWLRIWCSSSTSWRGDAARGWKLPVGIGSCLVRAR
jgi:MFS family permease